MRHLLPFTAAFLLLLAAPASAYVFEPAPGVRVYILESYASPGYSQTMTGATVAGVTVVIYDVATYATCGGDVTSGHAYYIHVYAASAAVETKQERAVGGCGPVGSTNVLAVGGCALVACETLSLSDRSDSPDIPTTTGETTVTGFSAVLNVISSNTVVVDRTGGDVEISGVTYTLFPLVQAVDYNAHVGPTPACAGALGGVVYLSESHAGPLSGTNSLCL